VLVCINGLIARVAPRWVFSQPELMFIYVMQTVSDRDLGHRHDAVPGPDARQRLLLRQRGQRLEEPVPPRDPAHLVPDRTNPLVLDKFYQGNADWLAFAGAWISPIFWWSGFICVLLGSMLCLNVILRRQWMDNEKLPFPIVYLPLEITRSDPESGPIWRNKLFAIGFGIPLVLQTHGEPELPVPLDPGDPAQALDAAQHRLVLTSPPWSAVGYMPLAFYPLVIGIVYFLPVEVSFSAWFFFVFRAAAGRLRDRVGPARRGGAAEPGDDPVPRRAGRGRVPRARADRLLELPQVPRPGRGKGVRGKGVPRRPGRQRAGVVPLRRVRVSPGLRAVVRVRHPGRHGLVAADRVSSRSTSRWRPRSRGCGPRRACRGDSARRSTRTACSPRSPERPSTACPR
jgi:hypothetical protein